MNLTDFLLARIAEDEEVARAAICQCGSPVCTVENGWYREDEAVTRLDEHTAAAHVMRFSPARVVGECEAKRRIVETLSHDYHRNTGHAADLAQMTLELLALPYADHPDYREEWRP